MPTIETALTRLLGIQHPILLSPMYGTAGGRLAAAVTHAGGFGMFGAGIAFRDVIPQCRADAGNARVGVGFIQWLLEKAPEALDLALETQPAAVMLSFGDPTMFAPRIKAAGSKLICQVQSVAGADDGGRGGRRCDRCAGPGRRWPRGDDAGNDGSGSRRGGCRCAYPGRRGRRDRRRTRPRCRAVAGCRGRADGHALRGHAGVAPV